MVSTAWAADRRRAEILPRVDLTRPGPLDHSIDGDADGRYDQVVPIEVKHLASPRHGVVHRRLRRRDAAAPVACGDGPGH
jgi:hypothetical protein